MEFVTPSIAFGYKSQPRSGGGNHLPGMISVDAEVVIGQVRDVIFELHDMASDRS